MPGQQTKTPKGGHNLSTSPARREHYARYAREHGMLEHKFTSSKEHRHCGPMGYARRRRDEIESGYAKHDGVGCAAFGYSPKTKRMLADARRKS